MGNHDAGLPVVQRRSDSESKAHVYHDSDRRIQNNSFRRALRLTGFAQCLGDSDPQTTSIRAPQLEGNTAPLQVQQLILLSTMYLGVLSQAESESARGYYLVHLQSLRSSNWATSSCAHCSDHRHVLSRRLCLRRSPVQGHPESRIATPGTHGTRC